MHFVHVRREEISIAVSVQYRWLRCCSCCGHLKTTTFVEYRCLHRYPSIDVPVEATQ